MAKRTKKMKKKRLKRHLTKQNKSLTKQAAVQMAVEVPLSKDELYQEALDRVYGGSIVPLERYINAKATLIHKCTECNKNFYGKPGWIVSKEDQKHVCYIDNGNLKAGSKSRKISEEEKLELYELAKAGTSISKLVKHFGISRYMVTKILKSVA